MKRNATPDQIADMLRAGATYRQIRTELRVSPETIANTRRTMNIPIPQRRRLPTHTRTLEETFGLSTEPYGDGHARWTGRWTGRKPDLWHGGRSYSAYRVAFRMQYGREPDGYVRPGCGESGCVAPEHVEDQPMRQKTRTLYSAIFGGAS